MQSIWSYRQNFTQTIISTNWIRCHSHLFYLRSFLILRSYPLISPISGVHKCSGLICNLLIYPWSSGFQLSLLSFHSRTRIPPVVNTSLMSYDKIRRILCELSYRFRFINTLSPSCDSCGCKIKFWIFALCTYIIQLNLIFKNDIWDKLALQRKIKFTMLFFEFQYRLTLQINRPKLWLFWAKWLNVTTTK